MRILGLFFWGFMIVMGLDGSVFVSAFVWAQTDSASGPRGAGGSTGSEILKAGEVQLSLTPRVVRRLPQVEVFFNAHPRSYVIPEGPAQGRRINLLLDAAERKSPIAVVVHEAERRLVRVVGEKSEYALGASESTDETVASPLPARTQTSSGASETSPKASASSSSKSSSKAKGPQP
ncbi:MAG: hypothetical protein WCH11_06425 [Bdellovibrio sp.]